jgi:alpha-tubulin suppressor-like RCC1 family protein
VLAALLLVLLGAAGPGSAEPSKASTESRWQAKAVTAGIGHTCALTRPGAVKCWGYNGHDELGTGDPSLQFSLTPVAVAGLSAGVSEISAGIRHSCAVTGDGTAMCWGVNYGGALGDGTDNRRPAPVAVVGMNSPVSMVSAGNDRSCALLAGGVKCWGTDYGLAPVDIPGLNGALAISGNLNTGCAITSARGVKCWSPSRAPTDVPSLSGVTAIATDGFSCAVVANGGVKCWGGDYGSTPVDVSGLDGGVEAIDTAGGHTCAITSTGGVKCWGVNDHGQLGDGTTMDRQAPVDVVGLSSGVTAIATGFFDSCAVLGTGGVKCWGLNSLGVLGDGTEVERHKPVSVLGFGPPPARCVVPNVVGKRLAKARLAVALAHCAVGRVVRVATSRAKNVVVRQNPKAGKRLKGGSKVNLSISR